MHVDFFVRCQYCAVIMFDPIASQSPTGTRTADDKVCCTYCSANTCMVQDYVGALKQKVVKLEAMAARNSNDKGIAAQVCLLCSPHKAQDFAGSLASIRLCINSNGGMCLQLT